MRIFIDHFPSIDDFAKRLASQIRKIDKDISITTFLDIRESGANPADEEEFMIMNKSDILIPIITSEFLSQYPTDDKYSEISESENKIIFPVIYNDTNWSSINWIVKSKIFPSNNKVFEELNSNEQASVVNELVRTIENIFSEAKKNKNKEKSVKSDGNKKELEGQVFISHSHNDADFAELLKLHLDKNGIDCWMDNERLKIGQDWREEIDTGISKSKAIIVIMSPEARKSEYVTYEWAFAWGKAIKILPIMLTQTSLHPRLESLQYMDFTNRVTRPYNELVDRIKEVKYKP